MNSSEAASPLGFVTCTEFEGWGLCGGLLLLNHLARPLEFHCTLPVKVSRTQSILFGASIRSYICGQVICRALLEKVKTRPRILLTDCPDSATVHEDCEIPLVLVATNAASGMRPPSTGQWDELQFKQQTVFLSCPDGISAQTERTRVRQYLELFAAKFDLDEPFERVRQAITEARDAALRAA